MTTRRAFGDMPPKPGLHCRSVEVIELSEACSSTCLERRVADAFGTPTFIYRAEDIEASYRALKGVCDNQASIFYSLKANPNLSVAAHLRRLGAGAEVSSMTEMKTALAAGYASSEIIFVGPLKTDQELRAAIENRIAAIVVDSLVELDRIESIALGMDLPVPVLLRINPNFKMDEAPIKMSGVPTQFGFSEDLIFNAPHRFLRPNITILGIHVYNGSRVLSAEALARNISNIFELSDRVAESLGVEPQIVDVGGGWGVPYFPSESALDADELRRLLKPVFSAFRHRRPRCRIITESGRFLVAGSGTLVSKVYAVKESHGERFAVIDAGYNCFMAAAGMGSIIQRNFPVRLVAGGVPEGIELKPAVPLHLAGPLCTPGDVLARRLSIGDLAEGSLVAFDSAGAYGPSASPVGFIGHGHPAEVMVLGDRAHLVRRRDSHDDLMRLQRNIFDG